MIEQETHVIDILLLTLLAATAIAVLRMRDLWAAVMLTSIYSFLGACWMLILDAPDVAFTEAAVGAGISTFLMLSTLALTSRTAKPPVRSPLLPLCVVTLTGAALVYGTLDAPYYGDPDAPIHGRVAKGYLEDTVPRTDGQRLKIEIPNIVTTVLASYRGYDTLGETVVVFTAAIGVMLLLRGRATKPQGAAADSTESGDLG